MPSDAMLNLLSRFMGEPFFTFLLGESVFLGVFNFLDESTDGGKRWRKNGVGRQTLL